MTPPSTKSVWRPWGDHPLVVAIVVISAIAGMVAVIQPLFRRQHQIEYVGRVIDTSTQSPIGSAQVTLEFQGVPPVIYTDSEGTYRFSISMNDGSVAGRVRVKASGYMNYDRNIVLSNDTAHIEDIRLNQAQTASIPASMTVTPTNSPPTPSIAVTPTNSPTNTPEAPTTPTPIPFTPTTQSTVTPTLGIDAAAISSSEEGASLLRVETQWAFCGGAHTTVIPSDINPRENDPDNYQKVTEDVKGRDTSNWEIIGVGSSVRLLITNKPENAEWAILGAKIKSKVISDPRAQEDVRGINYSGDCAGGEYRFFDELRLESSMTEYSLGLGLQDKDFDYFKLEPGETEIFNIQMDCKSPGIYRASINLPYTYQNKQGEINVDIPQTIVCPISFTAWVDEYQIVQFGEPIKYVWNKSQYDQQK